MKKILLTLIPVLTLSLALTGCSSPVEPKPTLTAPVANSEGVVTPVNQKLSKLNGSENVIDKDRIFAILDAEEVSNWTVNYSEPGIVSFEPQILSYGFSAKPAFMGVKTGVVEITLTDEDNKNTYKFSITVN